MTSEAQPAPDDFYSRALQRIQKFMVVLGIAALVTSFAFFGWRIGLGFTLGSVIACLNFYWLKRAVAGLAETTSGIASGNKVARRFLLRFVLMAIIAFAILTVSRESLYGLFAGLFLPAAAMLCEAVYEIIRVTTSSITDR